MENKQECCAAESVAGFKIPFLLKLKLSNMVLAVILLVLGFLYRYMLPEQTVVADLIMGVAAVIVSVPVLIYGFRGLLSGRGYVTEQLVSLAVIASMAQHDFISATLIPVFMVIAHVLEERSIMGVKEAIAGLKQLYLRKARKQSGENEVFVEPAELKKDDIIFCYPGEGITADGIVQSGISMIDQSSITGESLPCEVRKGSQVFAGTVNISGKITVRVSGEAKDFTLNRVASLLEEAEKSKTPVMKVIEKYAALYLPFILFLAAITLFFTRDINRAITILVISCPCALVLASPAAMVAALVVAAKKGILIKNTAFLELLSEIKTIVFDKTGTVTYGKLLVQKVIPENGYNENEVLSYAAVCASGSMHPVSRAVVEYCQKNGVEFELADTGEEVYGNGVSAKNSSGELKLGRKEWVCPGQTDLHQSDEISVWVAKNSMLLGKIVFSDQLKPEICIAVNQCRDFGIKRIILITGDKKTIGEHIGQAIGADEIICECLPQDKLAYIQEHKKSEMIMTVGDGINDALALSASDVGIAVTGAANDIAVQSADIALISNDLRRIPEMFVLSARTKEIINENIVIGAGFSLIMITLAAAGVITPVYGAFFHNIGSLFVVINSARILRLK